MTQPFRVAAGRRIDRSRAIDFRFDGRIYKGCAGDTLASALLANDVHLVGRSFKYHRPRGILSAGAEEPNALITIDRGAGRVTPNLRATQVELYDGLIASSQNRFPSLQFDFGALAGLAAPILSTGFYYKTLMWPPSLWRWLYEPAIRRAAGLGRAPTTQDPDRYLHQHAHCDLLIIGAGPTGLAAALAASATGARVILCDEQAEPGGSLLHEPNVTIDARPAPDWVHEAVVILDKSITLLPRTTAFGWYPDNMIGLVERVTDHLATPPPVLPRERLWQVRAKRVVLATGAIERPLIFPGNDRPGVMLASAARTYLHKYGVAVGKRIVIATADDAAYRAATDLRAAGVTIAAIVDQRPAPDSQAVQQARDVGIPIHAGMTIGRTEGRHRVRAATLANRTDTIPCDAILMSGGWTPTVHLAGQSRRPLAFDPPSGTYLPSEGAVGACAGIFDLEVCLRDGTAAGGGAPGSFTVHGLPRMLPSGPPIPAPVHRKAFVDFQNDVTTKDLATATDEGFVSIEHVKRYTTAGMATDQGKTSNLNALTTVAALTGQPMDAVGLTTFRPPYTPVTFGALAGPFRSSRLAPVRLPPIATPGAPLENVGTWKRARCFFRPNETIDVAVARECLAVRGDAGMLDASTLGKIEVVGPDAATFLSRIYTGDFTSLAPGRCRYALLLGEDGFIRDDGVVARLAADRFHVTTTTGNAAYVLHHMEDYLQTEFPELRVWLTSVTDQWAVIAVQGPRSEEVLAPYVQPIDLAAMPHMSVWQGRIGEVPIRLFRVSFTGEAGFEINLPPDHAQPLWNTLLTRDVTPYGTDAMHILRAEKGYIVIGQETDGTVTPDDVGLGWTIRGADFVGRRSLSLPDLKRADRRQLVGLLPTDAAVLPDEGAQVTNLRSTQSIGHVTSAYRSPTLGRTFALALIAAGRSLIGAKLNVPMPNRVIEVVVTDPVFLDKSGDRRRARPQRSAAIQSLDRHGPASEAPRTTPAAPHVMTGLEPLTHDLNQQSGSSFPVQHRPAADPPSMKLSSRGAKRRGDLVAGKLRSDSLPRPIFFVGPPEHQPAPIGRECNSVRLAMLAPTTRLSIRAGPAAATALGLSLGVLLPTVACRSVTARDRAALWLGPDEWLIIAPQEASDLAIQTAVDHPASIVDVSYRSQTIEISGPRASWCLNAFCPLDLDIRAFPVGMCARTLLGKAEIMLWRIAPQVFHIDVARSLASYVWECLEDASLEFIDPDIALNQ